MFLWVLVDQKKQTQINVSDVSRWVFSALVYCFQADCRLNEMFLNSLYKHFYLDRAATIINVIIDESVDHFQMPCLDITDRYSCCCHPQNIHKS